MHVFSRDFTVLPAHPVTLRSFANGMNHTCLCLPSRSWYSFTDPGGMEGWVDLGACVDSVSCFRLSVPVQLISWKGSSPKWPVMCRVGR